MSSPIVSFLNAKSAVLEEEMHVTKRNGHIEIISFDKILRRIKRIGKEVGIQINYTALVIKVIDQLFDGISTTKIDELTAEQCASMSSTHYDYNILASRILVSSHQKNTSASFSKVMQQLYGFLDKNGKPSPLVSDDLIAIVKKHKTQLDALCDYERDFLIDYFGFKTLERSYLMRINGKVVERPQHMWLRVAIGIHGSAIESIIETYQYMSQRYFIHATPTLFNAGTPRPQLSSCYLLSMESDSIDGIYNTLKDCALISKMAGGIGLHIHNIRATGSHIRGTNGTSNGIVPMLRVFNNTARYVDQCVIPETIIYTDEGPIKIESCISGKTRVFNMTGGIETIENVLEHYYEGTTLVIRNKFSTTPLQITPQHPIYAVKTGTEIPEWIDAQDLQVGDSIVYRFPSLEQDVANISEEDCKFYVFLFFYGGIKEGKYFINTDKYDPDYVKLDTICKERYDFIKTYLETRLVEFKEDCHTGIIEWVPALHLPFRNGDLYGADGKKRIHSRWLLLPINKTVILYDNLRKNSNNMNVNIDDILQWFSIRVMPNKILLSEITSIHKAEYSGILYDLQMEKQHDYLLENGLVHNGGGKRNGSFAIYLEPWHADIEAFLQMRKNHGDEEMKARDLFYALWIPDLFMERIKANGKWTLMCPDECPGLADVYGPEFVDLYEKYEKDGKGKQTVNARDLWFRILDAQMETGTPYILYKDAANKKSNQKNVGTIKSSNLCVAPETLVLTKTGNHVIKDLCDQTVEVWNGMEWSQVEIKKTGENQRLIRVEFDNGKHIECTPYHKFYILNSSGSVIKVDADSLYVGTHIEPFSLSNDPTIYNISVTAIIETNRNDDTYCFTELKRGRGTFNGIITGQCTEIIEYSDENETAVCNLASLALPTYIEANKETGQPEFLYDKLYEITKIVTKNLNKIIDVNFYPTEKTKRSNMRHRPIGIGVQGLADVFFLMGLPFASDEAKAINRNIFETIYFAALTASCELAEKDGPYETFAGSPASQGLLQFDLWSYDPGTSRYDWLTLKERIQKVGLRNSLLLAPMPTASTSQILGFNECIEPITSNIYSRRTLAGDFVQVNKYLMADLIRLDLWNDKIKNNIIANHGSCQQIDMIPPDLKERYKTVWEIPMRQLIDMSADRGAFICQSQSLNLWLEDPTYSNLTSMHFYSWSKGLKTGIYYLRRRAKHQAQQFTIEPEKGSSNSAAEEDDHICEMCSA